jgi:hypothetical protein
MLPRSLQYPLAGKHLVLDVRFKRFLHSKWKDELDEGRMSVLRNDKDKIRRLNLQVTVSIADSDASLQPCRLRVGLQTVALTHLGHYPLRTGQEAAYVFTVDINEGCAEGLARRHFVGGELMRYCERVNGQAVGLQVFTVQPVYYEVWTSLSGWVRVDAPELMPVSQVESR